MATTAKDIITAAYSRSSANDPDSLSTKQELIAMVSRKLLALYARASRMNPFYFGVVDNVTPDGTKWTLSATSVAPLWIYGGGAAGTGASRVISGTDPDANRVHIVPFRDLSAEQSPKVYLMGKALYSVGGSSDPSASANGDKLNIVVSSRHAALDPSADWDAAANTLADTWPEHYNDLLVIPVSRYLAIKDERSGGEVSALDGEYAELLELFDQEVQLLNQGVSARWGQKPTSPGTAPRIQ